MPAVNLPLLTADLVTCCSPVAVEPFDDGSAERLARVFKALGDPTRLKLLSLIAATRADGACVCDLVGPVNLSQPTVSHHLRQLVEAGVLTREQRGKWAYYRLVEESLRAVAEALAPVHATTSPQ